MSMHTHIYMRAHIQTHSHLLPLISSDNYFPLSDTDGEHTVSLANILHHNSHAEEEEMSSSLSHSTTVFCRDSRRVKEYKIESFTM